MRFRSLEGRIVGLFLMLILSVQLIGFVFIRLSIAAKARNSIDTELVTGQKVFGKLLAQNAEKLSDRVGLLVADDAFRHAIGTEDKETIKSVLENQLERTKTEGSLAMQLGLDGQIKASTVAVSSRLDSLVSQMVSQAEGSANGSTKKVAVFDHALYQFVTVPVKAPITIGWVVMAFPIGQNLATVMHDLFPSLQVSILTKDQEGRWITSATTLTLARAGSLVSQLPLLSGAQELPFYLSLDGSEYGSLRFSLDADSGNAANIVLQRSVNEATAPYNQVLRTLLFLTILATLIAVVFSFITAKRIAQPLRQLAEIARRLGRGEYQEHIEIKRDDEIGALANAFGKMQEGISKRELEIRRLAYWDTLTDLPNRAQFVSLLDQALAQTQKKGEACFVLMMDLDRFKNVNDVMGHHFGDALLRVVAERLQTQIDPSKDIIARFGGDEFAVLLPSADLPHAQKIAARILVALEAPFCLDQQTVDLGAGLGIAGFPDYKSGAESLLRLAEVAMYEAKQRSNGAVVYDAAIDKSSKQSLSLLSELRRAIERNEFRLFVQPKLMLSTGKVVGVESLVRWMHPEKGVVAPDNFIPFAEQTGFIRLLTRWIFEHSVMLCSDLHTQGIDLKMSINLSTRDLLDQDLTVKFAEILARHDVLASSCCLEITESAIMDDPVRAQQTLEKLHAMGFDLSIDDFGTGYSSLAYLKRLPVDELKIDKSFVLNMEKDADDTKIVRSTIDLGHNMGLRVVAEGIENEGVWHLLVNLGCDQGQGYFMSKPMPADQLVTWLGEWESPQIA